MKQEQEPRNKDRPTDAELLRRLQEQNRRSDEEALHYSREQERQPGQSPGQPS